MRFLKLLGAVCLGALVSACGGGGGDAGTSPFGTGSGGGTGGTGTTTGVPTVIVSTTATAVSATAPATITATVRSSSGAALSGQVVSFTTSAGLGSFSANSALTDASGVATVKLSPASAASNGADLVVAKTTISGTDVSGTIGFSVSTSTAPTVGTPSIALALSSTTVTATAPADVTATLKDASGLPLSGRVITFSSVSALGTFNPPSALTDANGAVKVKLSPAATTTNGAALAVAQSTVDGTVVTATAGFTATSAGAPAAGNPSISLSLSSIIVTTVAPVTATAVVKDGTGSPVAAQVVKFSTVDGLGKFVVNSALTDATGTASVVLSAAGAGTSGADQVLVSSTVNGTAVQASQGFQLTVTSASISAFTSDTGTLGAYGQANLTVNVTGAPAGTPVNIAVSSACVTKGKATLVPASASTTTGSATFTYKDAGCGATDVADALQASIVGTTTTRNLAINLTSPSVGSIAFTSATPSVIYLKGAGLTETSAVVFTVVDSAGNGLPNQDVRLDLLNNAAAIGVTMDGAATVTKKTDSLGHVSAQINSGTVPTPIRIQATLVSNPGVTTVSSSLAVAVGLPSELNFSLAQGTINIEGYNIDGTTNTYSIIASDRLSNPVPTGTAINFIAEGGQVEPIKTTALVNGLARASANFISASPRPLDGRITVLAYALGEESFLDTNGNNVWDPTIDADFQDLGSMFLSRKFLSTYFPATDQLIPLSTTTGTAAACVTPTSSLLRLDASIPNAAVVGGNPTCDGVWGRTYVRRAAETVLSTSAARPLWGASPSSSRYASPPANLYAPTLSSCPVLLDTTTTPGAPQNMITGYAEGTGNELRPQTFFPVGGSPALYNMASFPVFSVLVADANPVRINPVAAGSTVSASGTTGVTATVVGGSPVPSTTEASYATISVSFDVGTTSGAVTISVASPSGVSTSVTVAVFASSPPSSYVLCR